MVECGRVVVEMFRWIYAGSTAIEGHDTTDLTAIVEMTDFPLQFITFLLNFVRECGG